MKAVQLLVVCNGLCLLTVSAMRFGAPRLGQWPIR